MKRSCIALILLLLATATAHARLAPAALQNLMDQSTLVVYGQVLKVVDTEAGKSVKSSRPAMIATIKPLKIFKGVMSDPQFNVSFIGARFNEIPPRATLRAGERAVLFLIHYETGDAWEFVDPYQGKTDYDPQTAATLTDASDKEGMLANLVVQLSVTPDPSGALWADLVIRNDSAAPITIGVTMDPSRTLTITGPDGRAVPPVGGKPTLYVRRDAFVTLTTGRFYGFHADISKLFRFAPGTAYKAVFVYTSPDSTGYNLNVYRANITSNSATFRTR